MTPDSEAVDLKLFIAPRFNTPDEGDGGIRRVVEAQKLYLPRVGVQIVEDINDADVCAYHGGTWIETRKPVVSHCHGLYWSEYEWDNWAHELNTHVVNALRRADAVTAPSKWVAYALQRGMLLDPLVVFHGVDVDEWTPGAKREPYVLWNKTRVDSVCDPSVVNKLASMAQDVKFVTTYGQATENVEVTGRLSYDRAHKYVHEASVYLCTPRETFGIGTLEAMACETPILGWKWGGQAEFIEHKVTGYLAKPGDYDDLLSGLRYCLDNRVRLGTAARKIAETKFTWQLAMEKYATLYRQLMRNASKQARSPRVSVVITCYNLANTLPRAVASIQAQEDYDPAQIEIVIVNDNSPDDTAEVAAAIKSDPTILNPVQVVTNEENLYLSGSLNAGIDRASGKYIVPLDADNELGPRAIRLLSDALDKDRGLHIAYGAMQVIDEAGANAPFVSSWPNQFNFVEQMRHRNQIPSSSMYRRSVWLRINGYRRRCRTAEDADFWCRATSYGSVPRRVTDAVTLIYHDRSDSMSHVESDWDWTAWYSWSRDARRTPFGAAQNPLVRVQVPSYEPALITVVIPVGPGHGKYVIDAIDSLQAQTYLGWRAIVVNDSGEELPRLPAFVTVLETHGGHGPAYARNAGVEATRTPLWLPLDADDYLQPEALAILLAYWKKGRDNEYYYSDWIVQETGEIKSTPEFECKDIRRHLPHAVTALYTRESWDNTGGFDEGLDSWEDWDFVINLVSKGYCGVRVPYPLFYYRMQSGSRREEKYAAREVQAAVLANKWTFLNGAEEMACGCGGGNQRNVPVHSMNGAAGVGANSNEGMVLLTFKGNGGARTYRGHTTGRDYRFGADESHRTKYVYATDAKQLLLRPEFEQIVAQDELIIDNTVRLEAAGPPARA